MHTTLIGLDVGTTALKAVLIDLDGNRLADFARPYPIARPSPGAAEQDPADWMDGVLDALTSFAPDHDLSGLAGIGICSQVNTHVFVDAAGTPLLPAMVWQDTTAAPDAAALDAQVSADQKLAWFGGPMPIDASHALSRLAYVRRVHPDVYEKTRQILLPKDYCVMQLTGAVGSDPISAVGLVDRAGYVAPLLELVPGARQLLPPLHPFSHVAGRVRPGLPCAGVPVVVGAMDAWGGMFGVGVVADGDAMLQSGTSEIAGIVSASVHPTPGVILFPPYEGIVMHAAPTQSGGAAIAWMGAVLGRTPAELSALAATVPPSSAVPLFLPHLEGERAPLWDAASRGVFARIDGRAGAAEMARSVLEGVAFSVRLAFDALQQSAGRRLTIANIGGGGSRSDIWCQIRADALGFGLRRTRVPDAAAIGAAILAGLGSGTLPSLPEAVRRLVQFDRVFEPQASVRAYYDEKFGKYRELYEALRGFNGGYQAV
ncbi:MAG: carbohydrate kinase [Devosia nanyangense]|uniref:Carbohydrate kinase n=1 Tax=Devosia nanyangense TaxID=1228055 RepID=A0A933L5V6_9HYPH|nr:carbohydrate kinase [Devosia nanyangense]